MARPSSRHAGILVATLIVAAAAVLIAVEARVLVERDSKSVSAELAEDVTDLKAKLAVISTTKRPSSGEKRKSDGKKKKPIAAGMKQVDTTESASIKIKSLTSAKPKSRKRGKPTLVTTSEPVDDFFVSENDGGMEATAGDNVMVVSEKKFQQLVQSSSNSSSSSSSSSVIKSVSSSAETEASSSSSSSSSRSNSKSEDDATTTTTSKPVAIKTANGGLIVSRKSLKNLHKSSTGKPKRTQKPTKLTTDGKQVNATIRLLGPSDSLSTWEDLEEARDANGNEQSSEVESSSSSSSGGSNSTSELVNKNKKIIHHKLTATTTTNKPAIKKHSSTGRKHSSTTTGKPSSTGTSTSKPAGKKHISTGGRQSSTGKPAGGKLSSTGKQAIIKKHSSTGKPSSGNKHSTTKPMTKGHSTTTGNKHSSTAGDKHSTTASTAKPTKKHHSSTTAKTTSRSSASETTTTSEKPASSSNTTHRPKKVRTKLAGASGGVRSVSLGDHNERSLVVSVNGTTSRPAKAKGEEIKKVTKVKTDESKGTVHLCPLCAPCNCSHNCTQNYKELKESDKMLAVVVTNRGGFKGRRLNSLAVARILGNKLDGKDSALHLSDKPISVSANNTYVLPAGHYYFPHPIRFAGFESP